MTSDVLVSWDVTDNMLAVHHYEVSYDGSSWVDIGTQTSYLFTGLAEGTNYLYVRAYDCVGNYVEIVVEAIVDFSPPTISITNPNLWRSFDDKHC